MAHSNDGGAVHSRQPATAFEVLFLAPDAASIGAARSDPQTRVTSDAAQFRRLLNRSRPGMVVAFAPPATNAELAAVISQRRRRREMRAIFVNAPTLVEERLTMLRAGFDEALATDVDALELNGRLTLMADQVVRTRAEHRIHIAPEAVLPSSTWKRAS